MMDEILFRLHNRFSRVEKLIFVFLAYGIFVLVFFLGAEELKISINYLALIPLFITAAVFNLPGGIVSGILALPLNWLMLSQMGLMRYAPESLFIAWISGIVTGIVLGYFSGFYKRLEDEITRHAETIKQKNLLVKEMHHRVKNHLGILIGLIEVQDFRNNSDEGSSTGALLKRMQSVALVHDKLQDSQKLDEVDMALYLQDLLEHLQASLSPEDKEIHLETRIQPLVIPIQMAVMLGLLVNEVVTNSYKYAFTHTDQGKIVVKLEKVGSMMDLVLYDDGQGFDPSQVQEDSLGLSLIDSVIDQLEGLIERRYNKGTYYRFCWNIEEKATVLL